jgi:hypothetical protein
MLTPDPRQTAAPYGIAAPASGILLTSPRRWRIRRLLGPAAGVLIPVVLFLGAFLLASMFFPR